MVNKQPPKSRSLRTVIIWSILFIATWFFVLQILNRGSKAVDIPYSIFIQELKHNNVRQVTITEKSIKGTFRSPVSTEDKEGFTEFTTLMPFEDAELTNQLVN